MSPTVIALSTRAKIGQVNQRLKGWEAVRWVDGKPMVTDVLRAEVDRWGGVGAIYGILRADPWSGVRWSDGIPPERSAEAYAAVQDYVVSHSEGGIPTLFVEEVPHGIMALGGTTLPVNLALGASMDEALVEELASIVAAETRARGTHIALAAGLDVLRDPRWGRAEECWSEDARLAARMVAATVRGMQGARGPAAPIDDAHVAVVVKHLAAQGAGIGGRNGSGAPIGRRELAEVHLPPALAAAREGVAGFMAAYNDIDGIPCCCNRELLTGTIREAWGWDGVVMADGTAIDRLRDVGHGPAASAALALRAGVDLSLWDEAFTDIDAALGEGLVDEQTLDRAVERVLHLKRRVGLLDEAAPAGERPVHDVDALLDRAARESIVLLDDNGVLPLDPHATVAVVGPNADDLDAQLGDYTPPRPDDDPEASTVVGAMADAIGAERVHTARGSGLRNPLGDDGGSAALDAVRAAAHASDVCVVVLGGSSRRTYDDGFEVNGAMLGPAADTTNGEGVDLASVAIPEAQLAVVRAAAEAGHPVVGVLIDGRPRVLTELRRLCDAVLVVPFPGPRGGKAIAEALLGTTIPSGRLPATMPGADGVFPVAHDERRETSRGYVDADRADTIPMGVGGPGHGVTVELRRCVAEVSVQSLLAGSTVCIEADVSNARPEPMRVSVPLWGRLRRVGVRPRRRTLLGMTSASVAGGETVTVRFMLGLDVLGTWLPDLTLGAAPIEVDVWTDQVLDPPENACRIRVEENGQTGWER